MARKTVVLEPGMLERDSDDEPSEAEREAAAVAAHMQNLGLDPNIEEYLGPPPELAQREDAYISVFRIDRDTKRRVYCCQYAPAEFNLERLRRDKGGGYYWVRLIARNPTNKNRPSSFWQDFIDLEGPPRFDAPASDAKPEAAPAKDNGADVLAAVGQLAGVMMQGFQQMTAALAPKQESRMQILQEMAQLKTLFAPEGGNGARIEDFLKMMELVKGIMPRDGETTTADVFMGLVEKFAPVLVDAAQRNAAAPRINGAPGVLVPAGALATAPARAIAAAPEQPAPAQPVVQPVEDEMSLKMRASLMLLIGFAKAGKEPADYADMVLDAVPEEQWELIDTSETPVLLDYLAQFEPAVKAHAEWFGRLHAALKEALTPAEEPGTNVLPGEIDND